MSNEGDLIPHIKEFVDYKISWIVQPWKQQGRILWFRTANISMDNIIIPDGTYVLYATIEDKKYKAVWASINGLFETHILNFDNDIYGKEIYLEVFLKIRWNKKVNRFELLKKQIQFDIEFAQNIFKDLPI